MPQPLTPNFFQRDVLTVAHDLIGTTLHWHHCAGTIIETEAYSAQNDPACHTATRPTTRTFIQNHPPGTTYIYLNYGMYWLLNLLVKNGPNDGLILIRALAPTHGIPTMQQRRNKQPLHQLCSGPGKLTIALGITNTDHGLPLVGKHRPAHTSITLPNTPIPPNQILQDIRIGISQATERPWRFLLANHPGLSVPYGKAKPPKSRNSTTPTQQKRTSQKEDASSKK